jgi:hypothetical protein
VPDLTSIFFLFLIEKLIVFFIEFIAIDVNQFQRLGPDNLELGSALVAGDNIAFLYFIDFKIQWVFALWTVGHDAFSFTCTAQAL